MKSKIGKLFNWFFLENVYQANFIFGTSFIFIYNNFHVNFADNLKIIAKCQSIYVDCRKSAVREVVNGCGQMKGRQELKNVYELQVKRSKLTNLINILQNRNCF